MTTGILANPLLILPTIKSYFCLFVLNKRSPGKQGVLCQTDLNKQDQSWEIRGLGETVRQNNKDRWIDIETWSNKGPRTDGETWTDTET